MPAWDATLHWLKTTGNRAAGEVLIRALDSPCPEIRRAAVFALLARREMAGHRVILERIDPASEEWRGQLNSLPSQFLASLRRFLLDGDPPLREKVCHFLRETEQFEFVPFLANLLENREYEPRLVVANTLSELCRRLHQRLDQPDNGQRGRHEERIAEQLRRSLLVSVGRFPRHECREILDGLLLLTEEHPELITAIINNRGHPARRLLLEILSRETGAHVLAVVCYCLHQEAPPGDLVAIIGQRTDLPFVRHLLSTVGPQPSSIVQRNLKRFYQFRWLKDLPNLLGQLDDTEQQAIPALVAHSRIPRDEALKIIGHVLLHGRPAGRRAAAKALAGFHGVEANAVTVRAMRDPDPGVQEAIIPQLRQRGILGALPYIISKLESPHPMVRRAARKSLREFTFTRFLQVWDMLPPEVRRETGVLVKRVDPRTTLLLRAELLSPFRLRRLRALEVAQELELVPRLESSIICLLRDDDPAIRAEAAAALAHTDSAASYQALLETLNDANVFVRNIAEVTLEKRRRRMESQEQGQKNAPSGESQPRQPQPSGSISDESNVNHMETSPTTTS